MMRVLFVSHTGEKGGGELFLADMVKGGPEGWRAAFLSDGPIVADLRTAGRLEAVVQANRGLLNVKREGGSSLAAVFGLIGAGVRLARVARKYDVICANSQKALFVCAVASILARRPLVWILHDIITDPAFSGLNRRAAVTVANLFARRIVVNSKATAEGFVASGGKAGAVRLVYNGFDVDDWPLTSERTRAALRTEFGFDTRPVVALFGRLTPWKGQQVLLAALTETPGVQALIVGGPLFGEDAFEAELKALAIALGVQDRVRFTGFRSDVKTLMSGVDVVVHASTHAEPFGRVVVEGQLVGAPVIAAAAGGVTEIIEDEVTGRLVPPNSPADLAASLRRMTEDPIEARRLGEAGRVAARERFSLDRSLADFEAALDW